MTAAALCLAIGAADGSIASAATGDQSAAQGAAGHGMRAPRASIGPNTEISCTMSFAQSDYYYSATPSKTLTTFRWGSNGTLPIDCNGTIHGLAIDPSEKSQFKERGIDTATCTQGAGYAIATLTVPTVGGGPQTLTMPLENTFTGTTFDIAGTDVDNGLGAVGSWALPTSSTPCPATNPGPIRSTQVSHTFQFYGLSTH